MEQQKKAIDAVTNYWRMTNDNPVKKKKEKVITPEFKAKRDRLESHMQKINNPQEDTTVEVWE